MSKPSRKPYRRLVLLSEEVYKSALQCMTKDAISKTTEQTMWYEKDTSLGKVQKVGVPEEVHTEMSTAPALRNLPTSKPTTNSASGSIAASMHVDPEVDAAVAEISDSLSEPGEVDTSSGNSAKYASFTSDRKGIPLSYRKKYDLLLLKLNKVGKFSTDSLGQVVLPGGRILRGSNAHKLLRSLFTNYTTGSLTGFEEFVSALREEGILPSEITSNVGKRALAVQSGNGFRNNSAAPPGKRVRILRVY